MVPRVADLAGLPHLLLDGRTRAGRPHAPVKTGHSSDKPFENGRDREFPSRGATVNYTASVPSKCRRTPRLVWSFGRQRRPLAPSTRSVDARWPISMITGRVEKVVRSRPLPELQITLEWPDCTVAVLNRSGPVRGEERSVYRRPQKITKSSGAPPTKNTFQFHHNPPYAIRRRQKFFSR